MKLIASLTTSLLLAAVSITVSACNKADKGGKVGEQPVETVGADGVRTIHMTGNDTLQYNVKEITATPGEKIKVELTNTGNMRKPAMAHNFMLFNKTLTDDEVNAIAIAASSKLPDCLPADMSIVLAHTKMLDSKETDTIEVIAPTAEGSYPYVCTFPGHLVTMRGKLTVKPKP